MELVWTAAVFIQIISLRAEIVMEGQADDEGAQNISLTNQHHDPEMCQPCWGLKLKRWWLLHPNVEVCACTTNRHLCYS